jgi:hypothetical protein
MGLQEAINNIWQSDYVQINPRRAYKVSYSAEYAAVAAYLNGGPEPDWSDYSKMGKGLCEAEKHRRSETAPVPEPEPEPTPDPGDGTVHNVPTTIDKSGGSDVTSQLQSWLASLPSGTPTNPTIARFNGGAYDIRSMVTVQGKANFFVQSEVAELGGSTRLRHTTPVTQSGGVYSGNDGLRMLRFIECTNASVRFLTLEGASPMPSSGDGFKPWEGNVQHLHTLEVTRCVNMVIDRCDIWKSGGGDGINWGNQNVGTRSSGKVINNYIHDAHRCGVAVVGAQDLLIANNIFEKIGFWVVDLEPNVYQSGNYRVTIDGNTFKSNGSISPTRCSIGAFSGSKDGKGECHDLVVKNNRWENRPAEMRFNTNSPYAWAGGPAPYPLRIQRLTLTGNVASVNGPQVEIRQADTVRISGNSFGPISDPEIGIHRCTDVQVSGSTYVQDNNT